MSLRSVLIVEDVDEMRLLLEGFVGSIEGLKVSGLAASVSEARREISRRRPELVLLDEILPGESSLDLLHELISEGIAVILMTGVDDPTHTIQAGAFGRLVKPGWRSSAQDKARFREMIFAAFSAAVQSAPRK